MTSRAGKTNVTIKIEQEINRIYNKGYSMATVGEKMGLARGTICKHVWKPRLQGPISII